MISSVWYADGSEIAEMCDIENHDLGSQNHDFFIFVKLSRERFYNVRACRKPWDVEWRRARGHARVVSETFPLFKTCLCVAETLPKQFCENEKISVLESLISISRYHTSRCTAYLKFVHGSETQVLPGSETKA